MNVANQNRWSAFHVFLHDSVKQEAFIREWLAPNIKAILKNNGADSWFFIRYWEGGPHIRIRLLNLVKDSEFATELANAARSFSGGEVLTAQQYYQNHSFDGEKVDVDSLEWNEDGTVREFPYLPEFDRYGGPSAIGINESLFHLSSEIALALINATKDNPEHRLQLAMKYIITSVMAINPSRLALSHYATYYSEFWRSHAAGIHYERNAEGDAKLSQQIDKLKDDVLSESQTGALGAWVKTLKKSASEFRDLYESQSLVSPLDGSIVRDEQNFQISLMNMTGSQIHMLNNRIGVTPGYEFLFSSKIRDALVDEQETSGVKRDR